MEAKRPASWDPGVARASLPTAFTPVSYSYGLMAIAIGTAAELSAPEKPVVQRAELGF
jgi:hypothetical protein